MSSAPTESAIATFRSDIAAIDARIAQITGRIASAPADLAVGVPIDLVTELVSPQLPGDIARAYDSELNWLRNQRNVKCMDFAQTFLI